MIRRNFRRKLINKNVAIDLGTTARWLQINTNNNNNTHNILLHFVEIDISTYRCYKSIIIGLMRTS